MGYRLIKIFVTCKQIILGYYHKFDQYQCDIASENLKELLLHHEYGHATRSIADYMTELV